MLTTVAACSLFGLLVLLAVVATALTVRGDGYGRCRGPGPGRLPDAGGLPWAPYRDVSGMRWPW